MAALKWVRCAQRDASVEKDAMRCDATRDDNKERATYFILAVQIVFV